MKMTMKTLIFGFLATICAVSISSCGEDDPTPDSPKTNLEHVQEGILGTWEFQSMEAKSTNPIEIGTFKYSKCADPIVTELNEDGLKYIGLGVWAKGATDLDFNFTSETSTTAPNGEKIVNRIFNCSPSANDKVWYKVTEPTKDVFIVEIGPLGQTPVYKFELMEGVLTGNGGIVKVKQLTNLLGAKEVIWTFKK